MMINDDDDDDDDTGTITVTPQRVYVLIEGIQTLFKESLQNNTDNVLTQLHMICDTTALFMVNPAHLHYNAT